jgi:hypothetical protein
VTLAPATSRKIAEKVSRPYILLGRVLILLSLVVAIVTPWTETVWHFDRFPFGGEDFELSVFLIVAVLGLVLVLMQHCKRGLNLILALARWLSSILQDAGSPAPVSFGNLAGAFHHPPLPSPALDKYNLPIQV